MLLDSALCVLQLDFVIGQIIIHAHILHGHTVLPLQLMLSSFLTGNISKIPCQFSQVAIVAIFCLLYINLYTCNQAKQAYYIICHILICKVQHLANSILLQWYILIAHDEV